MAESMPLLAVPFREYSHYYLMIAVTSWGQIVGAVWTRLLAGRLAGTDVRGGSKAVLFRRRLV